jgi:hypothetical protein
MNQKNLDVSTYLTYFSLMADDFRAHTSCITEAERYEKSVYRGGNNKTKKNPQEAWNELIATSSLTAPASIIRHLEMLASLDNVPRKPKQFRNFTANSLNLRGSQATTIVDAMWKHLSQLRDEENEAKKKEEEQKQLKEEQSASKTSETYQQNKGQKLSKDHVRKSNNGKGVKDKDISSKKEVKKAMKRVLKKAPNRSMKLKDLRKAVRAYLECGDSGRPKIKKIIGQELVDNGKIKVEGKLVILQG